jgi:hypothetical protein
MVAVRPGNVPAEARFWEFPVGSGADAVGFTAGWSWITAQNSEVPVDYVYENVSYTLHTVLAEGQLVHAYLFDTSPSYLSGGNGAFTVVPTAETAVSVHAGNNPWALQMLSIPKGVLSPATGATAGTPGVFTPTGYLAPLHIADLVTVTASPETPWTAGQYVVLGDGSEAHWNGSMWLAGRMPDIELPIEPSVGLSMWNGTQFKDLQIEYWDEELQAFEVPRSVHIWDAATESWIPDDPLVDLGEWVLRPISQGNGSISPSGQYALISQNSIDGHSARDQMERLLQAGEVVHFVGGPYHFVIAETPKWMPEYGGYYRVKMTTPAGHGTSLLPWPPGGTSVRLVIGGHFSSSDTSAPITGVTAPNAQGERFFTPANAIRPGILSSLQLLGAIGQTAAWGAAEYVVLGDLSKAYWDGDSWEAGTAPAPPATGAVSGKPGNFTPVPSLPPADLAAMVGITASPATAWVSGAHVVLGDNSQAWWNGTAWEAGTAPVPPSGWEFDHADWQRWFGPMPDVLPVPTLDDRTPVGDVLQISGKAILINDGSVIYTNTGEAIVPAGTAVAVSHRGDRSESLLILTPDGHIKSYNIDSGTEIGSWVDRTYVAIGSDRGDALGLALGADGFVYRLSSRTKKTAEWPTGVSADQRFVSICSYTDGRGVALTPEGKPVMIDGDRRYNEGGLEIDFPTTGDGYTKVWTGYQAAILEASDGTIHPSGGYSRDAGPGTFFTDLPTGPVRCVAYQATWTAGEGFGAYLDMSGTAHPFGSSGRLGVPSGVFVAVTGREYVNDKSFCFLREDGAVVTSNGAVVRGPA